MVEKSPRLGGLKAVAEVSIFFAAFFLVVKYLSLTPPAITHFRLLGWNFFAHALMVIAPIGLIFLRRESPANYGLQRGQLRDPETRRLGKVAFIELAVIWLAGLLAASQSGHYRIALNLPLEWFAMAWPIRPGTNRGSTGMLSNQGLRATEPIRYSRVRPSVASSRGA